MGSPLAKHVPVVLTALLVPRIVRILQLLVPLEPMPVVQHRVIHVVRENTMRKQTKRLNRLLAKVAMWENTNTKREKHLAKHVPVVLTALLVPQVVHQVVLAGPILVVQHRVFRVLVPW